MGILLQMFFDWNNRLLTELSSLIPYYSDCGLDNVTVPAYKAYQQTCYASDLRNKTSHGQAMAVCGELQGTLPSMHTKLKYEKFVNATKAAGINGTIWVGGHDRIVEGTIEWQDGNLIISTLTIGP